MRASPAQIEEEEEEEKQRKEGRGDVGRWRARALLKAESEGQKRRLRVEATGGRLGEGGGMLRERKSGNVFLFEGIEHKATDEGTRYNR